ncbi:MAG: phosphotransferase [Lacibacter sp.]|nr:phosphotransferase [Lacibacter sp.]
MSQSVLPVFGLTEKKVKLEAFGSGLINSTWKVTTIGDQYILQRLNHLVFSEPEDIAFNISLIASHLKKHFPAYTFAAPVTAADGATLVYLENEGFFRLFPFIKGSYAKEVVESATEAYEAATQFGRFTHLLSGLDTAQLKITIPSFHDLSLRYRQFLTALEKGNPERIIEADALLQKVMDNKSIADQYELIKTNPDCKLRVTHHDTKISNVLFNKEGKGLCVIDLDTVMPGRFISDVGDMMRTYLSPVSEEESDFSKIEIRASIFEAIVQGYYNEMKTDLTETEKQLFFYSGKLMIYMQAIRFLTDYLNDDVYYGARYEKHNFIRASNQLVLLEKLMAKENELVPLINHILTRDK